MKRKKGVLKFYVPLFVIVSFIAAPFLWTIITSLKEPTEMFSRNLSYCPKKITLENYIELFTETSFVRSSVNSFKVAVITVGINMVVATMAGYAFSRYRFKANRILLKGILLIYMLPSVLFLTPLFILMKNLRLINTIWALVISYCTFTIPFSVWLMVGFMRQLPLELEEAARIDGCSKLKAFLYVCVPVLRPGLAATATYMFINSWNEYLFAVMFTNEKTQTVTVEIASYIGQYDIRWTQITAGGVMAALPVALLFMAVQKNFVTGIASGAVKG